MHFAGIDEILRVQCTGDVESWWCLRVEVKPIAEARRKVLVAHWRGNTEEPKGFCIYFGGETQSCSELTFSAHSVTLLVSATRFSAATPDMCVLRSLDSGLNQAACAFGDKNPRREPRSTLSAPIPRLHVRSIPLSASRFTAQRPQVYALCD